MKKASPKRLFGLKPSYTAVIFALLSPAAFSAVENTYPTVPLSLSGGAAQVKPNVLLFLDTSGSMQFGVDGNQNPRSGQRRQDIAINASKEMIANTRDLRWGLATFNNFPYVYGANIRVPIADIDDKTPAGRTHFTNLNQAISGLNFQGGTPTTSAYYELLRYYRGMAGAYPGQYGRNGAVQHTSPIEYRCQKNYIIFISDGQPQSTPTGYVGGEYEQTHAYQYSKIDDRYSMRVPAGTQPLGPAFTEAGPFSGASTGLSLRNSSRSTGKYGNETVFSCTLNNTCEMYTELGMTHFAGIAATTDLMKGRLDKEGKSFDEVTPKNNFRDQTITTYTIGFGADVPMLRDAAKAGGGAYFNANSSEQLQDALNQISRDIAVGSANFASVTPTASISDSSGKVESAETISLNTENWSSQLRFYQADGNGNINTQNYRLPTYNPSTSVAVISTPNGPRRLSSSSSGLSNATFGITDSNTSKWQDLANWLTRQGSADNPSWGYRIREHNDAQNKNRYLGDVLGGGLVAMGIHNKTGYQYGDPTHEYLAVGSNDGMVHIFKKHGAQSHQYTDVFQYIPGLAKRGGTETINTTLKETADKNYGGSTHTNLVNGPMSWYETYAENQRSRTFMTGVLGEGGRAAYALNIAGQNNAGAAIGLDAGTTTWLKNNGSGSGSPGQADYFGVPLWDTSSQQIGSAFELDGKIGHMFGEPMNGRLARKGSTDAKATQYKTEGDIFYATILGSGFNPPASVTNGSTSYPAPSIYVLDSLGLDAGLSSRSNAVNLNSKPGKVEKHISTAGLADNISTTAPRGMSAATGLDIDDDGVVDVAYAGDQNGNLYRFDFRGDISKWNAEIIFKGNENQPITAAPEVYRNSNTGRVTVLFGTGSELYASDLYDKNVQRLYGIQDPLTDDADIGGDLGSTNTAYPLTPSSTQLKQHTFSQSEANGITSRSLTSQGGLEASHLGWYMNLQAGTANGERVVDKPSVGGSKRRGGTVIFSTTTFNPASQEIQNSCTAEDATQTSSFIMTLDAETGGRPAAIRFLKDDMDYIGEYKPGSLSTVKLQQNGFSRHIFGGIRSGRDTKLGLNVPNDPANCNAIYGSSETGAAVQSFYCPSTPVIKRISWREIF